MDYFEGYPHDSGNFHIEHGSFPEMNSQGHAPTSLAEIVAGTSPLGTGSGCSDDERQHSEPSASALALHSGKRLHSYGKSNL